MVRRSAVRILAGLLEWAGYLCDECGCSIDLDSGRIATDETGTFPVCGCCVGKFTA